LCPSEGGACSSWIMQIKPRFLFLHCFWACVPASGPSSGATASPCRDAAAAVAFAVITAAAAPRPPPPYLCPHPPKMGGDGAAAASARLACSTHLLRCVKKLDDVVSALPTSDVTCSCHRLCCCPSRHNLCCRRSRCCQCYRHRRRCRRRCRPCCRPRLCCRCREMAAAHEVRFCRVPSCSVSNAAQYWPRSQGSNRACPLSTQCGLRRYPPLACRCSCGSDAPPHLGVPL
jgi:hypothetical protein